MPEIQYRYLYFNHMNLAQKSSFLVMVRAPTPLMHLASKSIVPCTPFLPAPLPLPSPLPTAVPRWSQNKRSGQKPALPPAAPEFLRYITEMHMQFEK